MTGAPSPIPETLALLVASGARTAPQRVRALLATLAADEAPEIAPLRSIDWPGLIELGVGPDLEERITFPRVADRLSARRVDGSDRARQHVDALRTAALYLLWGSAVCVGADGAPFVSESETGGYFALASLLLERWPDIDASPENSRAFMEVFDAAFIVDVPSGGRSGRRAYKTLSMETPAASVLGESRATIGIALDAALGRERELLHNTRELSHAPPNSVAPRKSWKNASLIVGAVALLAGVAFAVLRMR